MTLIQVEGHIATSLACPGSRGVTGDRKATLHDGTRSQKSTK